MSRLREWAQRLIGTFRHGRSDSDLEEELRAHAALAAEERERAGALPHAAIRGAAVRHGGLTQALEAQRNQRALPWMLDVSRDLR